MHPDRDGQYLLCGGPAKQMIFHGVLGALAVKRKEAARLQSTLREEIFSPAERTSELNASSLAVRETLDIDSIGKDIVHCAIKVHTALGPGLLESAYQKCLAYELRQLGHQVECELQLPIQYGPVKIDAGYRLDMLVAQSVIVENKAVDALQPIHEAQLLTYMKMKKLQLGYLLNWNVSLMKQGIKRVVNNFEQT